MITICGFSDNKPLLWGLLGAILGLIAIGLILTLIQKIRARKDDDEETDEKNAEAETVGQEETEVLERETGVSADVSAENPEDGIASSVEPVSDSAGSRAAGLYAPDVSADGTGAMPPTQDTSEALRELPPDVPAKKRNKN